MSFGGGKSGWLERWLDNANALAVNKRDGQLVLLSRKSKLDALSGGDPERDLNCIVMSISDLEEEKRIAFEIQEIEMRDQGWA